MVYYSSLQLRTIRGVILMLLGWSLVQGQQGQCSVPKISPPAGHSGIYSVGLLAIRGVETAFAEFNSTFAEYLTATVGPKFDPPIRFELVPLSFGGEHSVVDAAQEPGRFDFLFMNPSLNSCIESETNARSIATFVSRRRVQGNTYDLSQFGGVIFTRHDNTDIHSLVDLRGKRVSCASISGLGSGQMQFRQLQKAGLHHIQDLKQLVFMEKQGRVVESVISGEVDVGFVRTDQLERSTDPRTGELLDPSQVKIIEQQENVMQDDGEPFPFAVSTPLYPEWSLLALPHVRNEVVRAVETSLLEVATYAAKKNCSTNPEIARLAQNALTAGKYAGWIPSKSNMELRNMQEETGFITVPGLDSDVDRVRCVRATEIADAVVCPTGHFKRSKLEIARGCESMGIPCYGFQCLCSPCIEAYDVDFFPISAGAVEQLDFNENMASIQHKGCSKFSLCGSVAQAETIAFRAIDNRKRSNATFSVSLPILDDRDSYRMMPRTVNVSGQEVEVHEFSFDATMRLVGEVIVEVYINDEQIPESPFRVRVLPRDCEAAMGDSLSVPSSTGECVCQSGTVEIGGGCTPLSILLPAIIVPCFILMGLAAYLLLRYKRYQADTTWIVKPQELLFPEPAQVLGRGTFGLVLLADYRGTQVAVKRVLPPRSTKETNSKASIGRISNDVFKSAETAPAGRLRKESNGSDDIEARLSEDNIGARSYFPIARLSTGNRARRSTSRNPRTLSAMHGSTYTKLQRDFIEEMRLISKLRHPCIVAVMGATVAKGEEPMLVMEHMELGSLYDLLHNDCMVLQGETLLPMLQDISSGVRFLHSADPKVIHGDLKAQNILVDSRFRAKVADFGLSQKRRYRKVAAGTPFWMAPELLRNETTNTTESDVYAFGMILYEVFSRKDPYEGENHRQVLAAIADESKNKSPPVPKGCPPETAELMTACLRAKPADRPTFEEIDVRLKLIDASKFETGTPRSRADYSADLLSHIFPKHVADALREGRKVEPEHHDCVTVYFSDIVGFTEIAGSLSPTKVSDLLHRLYSKFDNLCGVHQVFKVETVGDAYMTVTNLATVQPNHVQVMAVFAFAALKEASETLIDQDDPSRGYVKIRVGFHSGPVVSHVVGSRNPRYSIIGDTVNTASRMESTSSPGRVHCSEFSATLLQQQDTTIDLTCRGTRNIKGKGEMVTYWVQSALKEPTVPMEMPRNTSWMSAGDTTASTGNDESLDDGSTTGAPGMSGDRENLPPQHTYFI